MSHGHWEPCAAGRQISRQDNPLWKNPCPMVGTEEVFFSDEKWSAWLCPAHLRLLAKDVRDALG